MGDEALGGQLRPAEIAPGQADAADRELSRHPWGHRLEAGIEAVDLGDRDGPADRQPPGGLARRAAPGGDRDRRLGGTVAVLQVRRHPGVEAGGELGRHRLPAGHHHAERGEGRQGLLFQEEREEGGREGEPGHPVLGRQGEEVGGVLLSARPRQDQPATGQEGGEDLKHRDVEGECRLLDHPLPRMEVVGAGEAQAGRDRPVRDHHPLGLARRARGVDDIGRMVRRHRERARVHGLVAGLFAGRVRRVDPQPGNPARRQEPRRGLLDPQGRKPRVVDQEGEALGRQTGVERHIGGSRFQNPEEAGDEIEGAAEGRRRPGSPGPRPPPAAGRPGGSARASSSP